ncbi:MAG: DUF2332 domain-containing protein [Novosphingobium sp.]|jgi:hypothetical protein|nr:DUF2332 domain-containing protein [Novosphingobium sp.]
MKQADKSSQMAVAHYSNRSVADAYANQIDYCRNNGATITARIVAAIAGLLDRDDAGPFIARIRDWSGLPMADGLPLRSAGALHGLHLSGTAPELAPIYADEPADDLAIVGDVVRRHGDALLPWLDGPPQTNEAGRSSSFIAAMLWLAEQGLPPRFECLEIGSSAGINLMIDRYFYNLGGVKAGPEQHPVMRFRPEWRGTPPPDRKIAIVSLRGCDVAPLDLTDAGQAMRLKAYIWPEHTIRFERHEAAIAAAGATPPDLIRMNAADFVERQLALPQSAGTTRLIMHSIVWQYVPKDQQERIAHAMADRGRHATRDRALAWIALEGNRALLSHGLEVRYWPGGEEPKLLAAAHAHGAWIEWLA